jgi:hypothetical protein
VYSDHARSVEGKNFLDFHTIGEAQVCVKEIIISSKLRRKKHKGCTHTSVEVLNKLRRCSVS